MSDENTLPPDPETPIEDDYEVGYGRPPKHSQFKPGQSGNPKGRPKGSKNFRTDVVEVLDMPVQVAENGRSRRISSQRASLLRLREQALAGNARALDKLLDLASNYNDAEEAPTEVNRSASDAAILSNLEARIRRRLESSDPSDDRPADEEVKADSDGAQTDDAPG